LASRAVIAAIVVVVVVVAVFGVYAAWTYPRPVLNISQSFTVGADVTTQSFTVPAFDGSVDVKVTIQSGGALWSADIASDNSTLWSHSAAQGSSTTYDSGWMSLSPGTYNFTFRSLGAGSLQATAVVSAKGGFW